MTAITILGTGNMGSAISALAQKGGHTVQSLDSKDTDVPIEGEMVILAVPYPALQDVLAQRGDQLDDKIIVDITNPVDFETFDSLTVSPDSSASAELESALSGARVLKAFNTNFAATLQSGTVGEAATTVLVAGDHADAKQQLIEIVNDAGLRGVDAGGLRRARELEALGFLQMTLAAADRIAWTGGFVLPSE